MEDRVYDEIPENFNSAWQIKHQANTEGNCTRSTIVHEKHATSCSINPVERTLSNACIKETEMDSLSQQQTSGRKGERLLNKEVPKMPPEKTAKFTPAPPPSSGSSEGVYMSLCVTSSKGNPGQEQGSQYMSLCTATRETGVSAAWRRVESTAAPTQQGSTDGPVYMNLYGQK